jgi:hypothetical protein
MAAATSFAAAQPIKSNNVSVKGKKKNTKSDLFPEGKQYQIYYDIAYGYNMCGTIHIQYVLELEVK